MFHVNGLRIDGEPSLMPMLDLAMRRVSTSVPEIYEPTGRPLLRPAQYRVLSMVPLDEGRRLTDLATVSDMTKQAMGEFVAELVEEGLVEVLPDPSDGRAKLVRLTPTGREEAVATWGLLDRVDALWADRVGSERLAEAVAVLREIAGIA